MNWKILVMDPMQAVMERFFVFVPQLMGVLLILLVGWLIAVLLRKSVVKVLKVFRVDELTEKAGLQEIFEKGGIKGSLSELLAKLVYWIVMLVVFVSAVNAFGLTVTAELLDKLVVYMPKVVAAIFILVLGLFFSTVMSSIVSTASANAGIKASAALGQLTKTVVIAFAVLTSLEQLEISTRMIEMAIFVTLGSFGLALSIALGLGAKDLAGKALEDWVKKFKG